jgi:hypothetical protein
MESYRPPGVWSPRTWGHKRHTLVGGLAAGFLAAALVVGCSTQKSNDRAKSKSAQSSGEGKASFVGSSEALKKTVVVPTLDTPFPKGKSAVWCSSFQIAWNRFKSEVAKGPILLANAQGTASRLNGAPQSDADLPAGTYYAAAGWLKDGIIPKIRAEMAKKFPEVTLPSFSELSPKAAMAFGYLHAGFQYKIPYTNNPKGLIFTNSDGKRTAVHSFGILKEGNDYEPVNELRQQVIVKFNKNGEFALDLSNSSSKYQLLVARIGRRGTLAEMLADIRAKTKRFKPQNEGRFGYESTFLVPNMHWQVAHHFRELEGHDKLFLNPTLSRYYMKTCLQVLDFRMDRRGVRIHSSGDIFGDWTDGDEPEEFHFDRPYLIAMQKRGAKHPFFVMWVDNAELLQEW